MPRYRCRSPDRAQALSAIGQNAPFIWMYSDFIFEIPKKIHFITTKQKEQYEQYEQESNGPIENQPTHLKYIGTENNKNWQGILTDILAAYQMNRTGRITGIVMNFKIILWIIWIKIRRAKRNIIIFYQG